VRDNRWAIRLSLVVLASTAACGGGGPSPESQVGAPCSAPNDCRSKLCLDVGQPSWPATGWTGSVCTRSCKTDTDCVAGWTCHLAALDTAGICECRFSPDFVAGVDGDCDGVPDAEPAPITQTTDEFQIGFKRSLDLLFVVDNSNSMGPKQQWLLSYFPNLIQPLKDLPVGVDLHVGIVTTDFGAGVFAPPSCNATQGDQGALQNRPLGTSCTQAALDNPDDRFLSYSTVALGGATANFTGDVGDAFTCYAAVGTGKCGYEQPLASLQAALDGCTSAGGCVQSLNEGFLREDAYLAVVILTDGHECSAPTDTTLFDPGQTTLNSVLGPLTTYRCFEFGVLCDGAEVGRQPGARTNCVPGSKDADPLHQLIPVATTASFLKSLKADPREVFMSVIAGPPEPVEVGSDANGYPTLTPACTGSLGSANPSIRLSSFLEQFDADRATFVNLCAPSLQQPIDKVTLQLEIVAGPLCLSAPPADDDPTTPGLQPQCVAEERPPAGDGTTTTTRIPRCAQPVCDPASAPVGDCACASHPDVPCWYVWEDGLSCPDSRYRINVDHGIDAACNNPEAPVGTTLAVYCAAE
jgi:hypothetical protein